ncbi:MAG: class II fructose-bisphosphate aldolase [Trueperaceae bacterium]
MTRIAATLLDQARRGGYALAALNAVNLETAEAIVAGAEAERAPVILQISQNAVRYSSLSRLAALGRVLRDEAAVPVVLHFDHAENLASALRALDEGFDSVMLEAREGGPHDYERAIRELVEAAHAQGAAVEAELEAVRKGDRASGAHLAPATVRAFVDATGCDAVAIDIGTEHKQTQKSARLDFGRLRIIAESIPQPLVLHGSSGVSDEDLAEAVSGGIAKVNVATALALAFTGGVRDVLGDADVYDPRDYLAAARNRMANEARRYLRVLGASGRADDTR